MKEEAEILREIFGRDDDAPLVLDDRDGIVGRSNGFSSAMVLIDPAHGATLRTIADAVAPALGPFYELLKVPPWRSYVSTDDALRYASYYGVDPHDPVALATAMTESATTSYPRFRWVYGLDAHGVYAVRTDNPAGRWTAWCLDARWRAQAPMDGPPYWSLKMTGWVQPASFMPTIYPWWFPTQTFALVVCDPAPAWLYSHEYNTESRHMEPNPRFIPMAKDIRDRLPDHLVIPVRYA